MTGIEIAAIALGVSLDAFAISLGLGMSHRRLTLSDVFRVVVSIGFPALVFMAIGLWLGERWLDSVSMFSHHVTPWALAWIAYTMIKGQDRPNGSVPLSPTELAWLPLLMLGVVTSVDVGVAALAIGIRDGTNLMAALAIPGTTSCLAALGLLIGSRVGSRAGRYAKIAGGSVLFGAAEYCCFC